MKKRLFAPLVLTSLGLALAGCGGESATVNEDPNKGIPTYSNGCDADSTEKCLGFYVDYPVDGLNFDCSTDTRNHYATKLEGGLALGGCLIGDKAKFYIKGSQSERKIVLGDVDLAKVRPLKVRGQPAAIGLIDIATAMTGKEPTSMTMSDETFKVMVGLVRVFQAIGLEQDANQVGDVQPLELTDNIKNNLTTVNADIGVADFINGSYVEKLKPWVNIEAVDEASAVATAQRLVQQSLVNIYSTNFLIFSGANVDIQGFTGKSELSTKNESIANMYLVTDRQGYTSGYAMQWVGVPQKVEGSTIADSLLKFLLLNQVVPQKLNVNGQQGWINPLTRKITSPLVFKKDQSSTDKLEIFQGALLNNTNVAGTEYMYKRTTGATTAPADPTIYGKWRQTLNADQLSGGIDIYKTNPANYLDRKVFLTKNTVKAGEKYYFPLYANITFAFDNKEVNPNTQTLGIVIDENGDIRTNLGKNSALNSDTCADVDPNTYVDKETGVQQYRIGTTGTAYINGNVEKSITLRMILANPVFGSLDGALAGLNETLVVRPTSGTSAEEIANASVSSGGIRLNLQRLINEQNTNNGVNITSWDGDKTITATWVNLHAFYQSVYNNIEANKDKTTPEQKELAKRLSGTLTVSLPQCYTIKTK
ncbi:MULTISPECIES: hypothetical protein [Acinetobacter]|jgi:hypothetical protein|uniref:putative pilus system protein FilF n=1 Tax=Acinetobacter TaxID=469 RepID=UPI0004EF633B|nr:MULTISPECIES: hypothetical protein [Acinetobacter]MBP2546737.1 hypothetical protein [Acinetobacter guillouiae]MCG7219601.1 hypothetical protein [Acinetobacter sp. AG3]MDO6645497.1 hypothetical protein [Acinetobacter guillouiae]BAP38504.1 pilus assembly protein FilF [Acinetobacter guillouiae]